MVRGGNRYMPNTASALSDWGHAAGLLTSLCKLVDSLWSDFGWSC